MTQDVCKRKQIIMSALKSSIENVSTYHSQRQNLFRHARQEALIPSLKGFHIHPMPQSPLCSSYGGKGPEGYVRMVPENEGVIPGQLPCGFSRTPLR